MYHLEPGNQESPLIQLTLKGRTMKKIAQLILIIGFTSAATSYPMGEWLHKQQLNFLEWRDERQINKDYTRMVVIPVTKLIQEEAKNTPRDIDAIIPLLPKRLRQILDSGTPTRRSEFLEEVDLEMVDQILNEISQDPNAFFYRKYIHQYIGPNIGYNPKIVLLQGLNEKIGTKVSSLNQEFLKKYPDAKLNLDQLRTTQMIERLGRHWQLQRLQKPAYFESVIAIGWGDNSPKYTKKYICFNVTKFVNFLTINHYIN
jgi:hypothetical protein